MRHQSIQHQLPLLGCVCLALLAAATRATPAAPLFPEQVFHVGAEPFSIVAGDFDRDGFSDLAVANVDSGDISVLLGNADGAFHPESRYPALTAVLTLAAADFTRDRITDLLTCAASGGVRLMIGRGDGSFAPGPTWQAGEGSRSVILGDFNGDGQKDAAVANYWSKDISIFLAVEGQIFSSHVRLPVGGNPLDIVARDFNGDGRDDLAVATNFPERVRVYLTGQGVSFGDPAAEYFALDLRALAAGDFNHDGTPDLAASNAMTHEVLLWEGLGDGRFSQKPPLSVEDGPFNLTVTDLNGDGRDDLVVGTGSPRGAFVTFLGQGDGTLRYAGRYFGGVVTARLASSDFNSDGRPDLAFVDHQFRGNVTVVYGLGNGAFQARFIVETDDNYFTMAATDLDSDGHLDLVGPNSSGVSVLIGRGDGGFADPVRHFGGGGVSAVAVADFDNDGRPDASVNNRYEDSVSILKGRGDGSFDPRRIVPVGRTPESLTSADFNLDGVSDLAVANGGSDDVSILLGRGDGTFAPENRFPAARLPVFITVAEFNADGVPDLSVRTYGGAADGAGCAMIFLGRGDGSFGPGACHDIGRNHKSLTTGDLNGDGRADLVVVNYVSEPLSIFLGRGDGSFYGVPSPALGDDLLSQSTLAIKDFDSDGNQDIAVAGDWRYFVLLPGLGNGSFGPGTRYVGGGNWPTPGDFNGDGRLDLAIAGIGLVTIVPSLFPLSDIDEDEVPFLEDNCALAYNPGQDDADDDGRGDLCDNCPMSPNRDQYDSDVDGPGDACDTCPAIRDPDHNDLDRDGVGDLCDNCSSNANPDQADGNRDGSGDACQPHLAVVSIHSLDADTLEAHVEASDPNGDVLSGTIELVDVGLVKFVLHDLGASRACDDGYFPEKLAGQGVGFANGSIGYPAIFDFGTGSQSLGLECSIEGTSSYGIQVGPCEGSRPDGFVPVIDLSGLTEPLVMCVRRSAASDAPSLYEITLLSIGLESAFLEGPGVSRLPVAYDPPQEIDISSLALSAEHLFRVTITDGNTAPQSAESAFAYSGERRLVVRSDIRPVAVASVPEFSECDRPGGGLVILDGSNSSDPNPGGGIVSYEWFRDFGLQTEQSLGTGVQVSVILPLGENRLTLEVRARDGLTATAHASVTVRDLTAPALEVIGPSPDILWPPNHRLIPVQVMWRVSDACDPVPGVSLVSATSSEPDDSPGGGDGNTSGDIQDVSIGTSDDSVLLRAERSGNGTGRVYTLTFVGRDASGNAASSHGIVRVPRYLNATSEPVDIRVTGGGLSGTVHLDWSVVSGADTYDLIRGEMSRVHYADGWIDLGKVDVLISGQTEQFYEEDPGAAIPTSGQALFYLVQYRDGPNVSGWGTESNWWPAMPSSCDVQCPGGIFTLLTAQSP